METVTIGLLLSLTSFLVLGVLYLVLKNQIRRRQERYGLLNREIDISLLEGNRSNAQLLVKEGGSIAAINSEARKWFGLNENEAATLERISELARPKDAFFNLCTEPGETQLALKGRFVKATSTPMQIEGQSFKLLTLEPYSPRDDMSEQSGLPPRVWEVYRKISAQIGVHDDRREMALGVMEAVEFLLPADKIELSIWSEKQSSLISHPLSGLPGDPKRVIEPENEGAKRELGWFIYDHNEAVLVQNLSDVRMLQNKGFNAAALDEYQSIIGVPLRIGQFMLGSLVFLSSAEDAFHQEDLDLLNLIAPQISFVLHDFAQREREGQRSVDLTNLLSLTQGFTEIYEARNVYESLLKMIAPLVPVEVLGFLIYDEKKQVLEGRNPFQGLPPQFIELYFAKIQPNSEAEKLLLLQEAVITEQASESKQWEMLGLVHLSQAASLQETALIPLVSGGRMLGYLQASNHSGGAAPFSQGELNLLKMAAAQAAPIIENATLLQENVRHAQHTASLRRIANLASSASEVNEIIRLALRELSVSFDADISLLFLLDENNASLKIHPSSVIDRMGAPSEFPGLMMGDVQFPFSVTGSLNTRLSVSCSRDDALIPYYKDAFNRWNIESVVMAPLIVRDEGIGEIWIGSRKLSQYNPSDVQFLVSAATQIASLIENARLMDQTDEDVRRRLNHLTSLRRIAFEMSSSADRDYLLQIIFDEALRLTGAERGNILLFDPVAFERKERVSILSLTGDIRSAPLMFREREIVEAGSPTILSEKDLQDIWLPDRRTRFAFLTPVFFQQQKIGLVAFYSRSESFFDPVTRELVQTLASQVGAAVGSDYQLSQLKQQKRFQASRIDTLSQIFKISQALHPESDLKDSLSLIASGITEATPFRAVLTSIYDPVSKNLTPLCAEGIPDADWHELKKHNFRWKDVEALLQPDCQVENGYFIPAERETELDPRKHPVLLPPEDAHGWNQNDVFLLPLLSGSGDVFGLISLGSPRDGSRPDEMTFETLSLFGAQAVSILEINRYRHAQAEKQSALETLRNRLRWDLDQARQEVEDLRKEVETLTSQREELMHTLHWANAVPDIVNMINQQTNSGGYIEAFAREMQAHFDFDDAIVTWNTASGPRLLTALGENQKHVNIDALLGQHNPIRHVFQEGKTLFVKDAVSDPIWRENQMLSTLETTSLLAIPIWLQDKVQYVVLLLSKQAKGETEAALAQIDSLVRLAELGLENLQNLEAANARLKEVDTLLEFNRKLDDLDPQTILNTLLQTVLQIIPAGEGAWVGLWDEKLKHLTPAAALGYPSPENMLNIRLMEDYDDPEVEENELSLPLRACRSGDRLHAKEVNFPKDYHLTPADLIHYRQATAGRLPLSSLVTVLRRSERLLGVLVIDHFSGIEDFTSQDEALAVSLSQQAVLALENSRLFVESENRSSQLQSLTESTTAIASTLQVDELTDLFLQQVKRILPYDTATLWLRNGQQLSIVAVEGFDDQESRIGLSVSIEDSVLFQEMDRDRKPISIGDVRKDERFPPLAHYQYLSWLGVPMMSKTGLMGVIALEKREPDSYSADQIRAGVTFASQAAMSLSNARLLEESRQRTKDLDQRTKRLSLLNQLSDDLIASLDIDQILGITIEQIRSALNVTRVAAVMIREDHCFLTAETPSNETLPIKLAKTALLDHLRQSLGVFISSNIELEKDLRPLCRSYFTPRNIKSVLMIPLETSVRLHGWIWLQSEEVYRFSSAEIDLARTMANQAAIAVQNASLFNETQRLTGDLEKEIEERTKALKEEHLQNQTLLKMINQLSVSLEIEDVMEKTLGILNDLLGADQCFILLAGKPARIYTTGEQLVKPEMEGYRAGLFPQDLSAWMLSKRSPLQLDDIQQDERWKFDSVPDFHSVLAVPLLVGEQFVGTLILLHRKPGAFRSCKMDFVQAAARQLSIAINNAQLFNLAREQSDRLVSMLRNQQIDSSRSYAILEAVADGVLVTDADNIITLFNTSAEAILGLDAQAVTGRLLSDLRTSLKMEDVDWFETILRWSEPTGSIPEGESYARQLDLSDGRVVLVHLAPVILDKTFLGTVSILRDITQEVMVDRLKSDFVANVSHELRTPLTSIKGYADLMLMGASGELSEQQLQFMRIIRENTRRLNVLVNDLLDISHIDSGQLALSFKPLDLLELSQEIIKDIRGQATKDGKPMEFGLAAPQRLPLVSGDPEKIHQVLMNLVSNSYHYTPEGGKVRIQLNKNGKNVRIDVVDNGIGITQEVRERIFERFYRGDHPFVLATAGTGLGLAISRILVEMHGGKMWFESSGISGEGSVFSFTLPLQSED